jgi:hypothetical protein
VRAAVHPALANVPGIAGQDRAGIEHNAGTHRYQPTSTCSANSRTVLRAPRVHESGHGCGEIATSPRSMIGWRRSVMNVAWSLGLAPCASSCAHVGPTRQHDPDRIHTRPTSEVTRNATRHPAWHAMKLASGGDQTRSTSR